jgi:hypothetical protein
MRLSSIRKLQISPLIRGSASTSIIHPGTLIKNMIVDPTWMPDTKADWMTEHQP